MGIKEFKIEFYRAQDINGNSGHGLILSALELMKQPTTDVISIFPHDHQVRNLSFQSREEFYQGIFGTLRDNHLPHIVSKNSDAEKPINMEPDENLIEKNYFLYSCKREVLAYQANGHGSYAGRLAKYISKVAGQEIILAPVLNNDSARRLMEGDGQAKSIEFSFSWSSPDVFNNKKTRMTEDLFKTLSKTEGARLKMKITPPRGKFLSRDMKTFVQDILSSDVKTTIAKLTIENEDGMLHPVDLVASRLIARKQVKMAGRYPDLHEMFSKLYESLSEISTNGD
ncbi:MAG: hypothetical protein HQL75_05495 [Magnetococcales bacterium]|nr:hypothetical protein [Magnetococcales bacterium]